MQTIPLLPIPSQIVKAILENQNCQISIYQKQGNIFVDVNVDGTDFVVAVIGLNVVPIVCREYLGFQGNLLFIDSQGSNDPTYEGLGNRYNLVYLTAEEYALISE
jgi:hypothetical protein